MKLNGKIMDFFLLHLIYELTRCVSQRVMYRGLVTFVTVLSPVSIDK